MKRFKLSPEAARDVREIWAYIAEDSIQAARRVRLQILDSCRRIARSPGIGHRRKDLTDKQVLFWPVGSHVIIYREKPKAIEIVRVLHGARDIPRLLQDTSGDAQE